MSRLTRSTPPLLLLSLLIGLVGCQDPNKDMAGDDQAAQSAADRIRDLEDLLDQAEQDRMTAEDQALALRTERDRLKAELAARGTSEPAAGWESVPGGAMISIEGTVLFGSGKAVIKPTGKQTLDEVARAINEQFPGHDVYVFGHTDNEPIRVSGWKDNYELSCQRALSVLRHLKGKGVMQYVAACGWGEDRPVADNASGQARQANRRVEIFAMAPQQPITGTVRAGP